MFQSGVRGSEGERGTYPSLTSSTEFDKIKQHLSDNAYSYRKKERPKTSLTLIAKIKNDFIKAISLLNFSRTKCTRHSDLLDFAMLIALYC